MSYDFKGSALASETPPSQAKRYCAANIAPHTTVDGVCSRAASPLHIEARSPLVTAYLHQGQYRGERQVVAFASTTEAALAEIKHDDTESSLLGEVFSDTLLATFQSQHYVGISNGRQGLQHIQWNLRQARSQAISIVRDLMFPVDLRQPQAV
jgi:hypothetical protein